MTLNDLISQPNQAKESIPWPAIPGSHGTDSALYQPVDVHHALSEVRRMSEFQPPESSWIDELWKQPMLRKLSEELSKTLGKTLNQVLEWLSHIQPRSLSHLPENMRDVFSVVVGCLLVLVGLFALYLLLGWLLRLKEASAPKPPPEARMLEKIVLVSSAHHYQESQTAAEVGNYALALRQLYMAMLCLLDERKLAPYEATRTNLEYSELLDKVRQVRGRASEEGDMKLAFERLARQFEMVRYGLKPMSAGQFELSRSDYRTIQKLSEGWVHE